MIEFGLQIFLFSHPQVSDKKYSCSNPWSRPDTMEFYVIAICNFSLFLFHLFSVLRWNNAAEGGAASDIRRKIWINTIRRIKHQLSKLLRVCACVWSISTSKWFPSPEFASICHKHQKQRFFFYHLTLLGFSFYLRFFDFLPPFLSSCQAVFCPSMCSWQLLPEKAQYIGTTTVHVFQARYCHVGHHIRFLWWWWFWCGGRYVEFKYLPPITANRSEFSGNCEFNRKSRGGLSQIKSLIFWNPPGAGMGYSTFHTSLWRGRQTMRNVSVNLDNFVCCGIKISWIYCVFH